LRQFAAAAIVFTILAITSASLAAASCNPGRNSQLGNWFDGWYKTPPSGVCYTGTLSNILVYQPYVLSADVTAWVMVANNATGSYGQIGWLQQAGARYNFTESSTTGGGFQQRLLSASAIGSSHYFKVTYSIGVFTYYIDGSSVDTDSAPNFGGCVADNYGELTNLANQMPGGASDHELFESTQVRRSDTGNWSYMDGTTDNQRPSSWGNTKASSTRDEIWEILCFV